LTPLLYHIDGSTITLTQHTKEYLLLVFAAPFNPELGPHPIIRHSMGFSFRDGTDALSSAVSLSLHPFRPAHQSSRNPNQLPLIEFRLPSSDKLNALTRLLATEQCFCSLAFVTLFLRNTCVCRILEKHRGRGGVPPRPSLKLHLNSLRLTPAVFAVSASRSASCRDELTGVDARLTLNLSHSHGPL
jgi:hypothetical protein